MLSIQAVLAALPRTALRHLLASFDLVATDARKTDSMCQALAKGLPADAEQWLIEVPALALREAIDALDVAAGGRSKAVIVAALAAELTAARRGAGARRSKAGASKAAGTSKQQSPKAVKMSSKKAPPAAENAKSNKRALGAASAANEPRATGPKAKSAFEQLFASKPKASKKRGGHVVEQAQPEAKPEPQAALTPEPDRAHDTPVAKRAKKAAGRAGQRISRSTLYAIAGEADGNKAGEINQPSSKGHLKPVASKAAPAPAKAAAANSGKATVKQGDKQPDDTAQAAKKSAAPVPRHMLSWTEAVALATKRGQSAASMIGQPAAEGDLEQITCPHCSGKLSLQPCQIHACDHRFISQASRKICAECMFERNNISVDAFHDRLKEDWMCSHCEQTVPRC